MLFRSGDGGSGMLKRMLTESLNECLRPHRLKRKQLEADPGYVRDVLRSGIREAREVAEETLDEVRRVMNMNL